MTDTPRATKKQRGKPRKKPVDEHIVCPFCKAEIDRRDEADDIYCCEKARWQACEYETYLDSR